MSRNERCSGLVVPMGLALCSMVTALIANGAEPDLTWSPKPFVFEQGRSVRYIDFEGGSDENSGAKARPWQHHPWDKNSTGKAAACKGVHTYCFKRGVAYRGALVAKDSGEHGNPIRLTVDPSWGRGEAGLYGSAKIDGGWHRCTAATARSIPAAGRSKTWYKDVGTDLVSRLLCETFNGKTTRIPIAREPDWSVTDPDDPRSEWWEFTGHVFVVHMELDDAKGFQAGDKVTGTGKWIDFDEDRDNVARGRNRVTGVTKNTITLDSFTWKKGEFRRGSAITNGKVTARIRRIQRTGMTRLRDKAHPARPDWVGATMWCEGSHMSNPGPYKIAEYLPAQKAFRLARRGMQGPQSHCRYYLENLPVFLDSPGEFCLVEKGAQAGRLFLRLPDDRNPNHSVIEAARDLIILKIENQNHIEISGLDVRYTNSLEPDSPDIRHARLHMGGIHIVGNCSHIAVRNCRFSHVATAVQAFVTKKEDVLDYIDVTDNDMRDIDCGAICLSARGFAYAGSGPGANLVHARVLRNRVLNTGHRSLQRRSNGLHAITIEGGQMVEIAGNIVDRSWGCGIWAYNGMEERLNGISRPLVRILIHHNKVTNSLLGLQDYGGIASWMAGPSYVYNNISGNAVGYKHHSYRTLKRKDWYRTSCYGVGLYIDGQYKGYVFNNILWGKNNNVNDRIYNSCAFNEAMGFLNTVFNNTMYNCGVGLHKGMTQHNRCYYLGNLMLDIGHKFIQQEPKTSIIEFDSLAYARNVFQGKPANFGLLGGWGGGFTSPTLKKWRAELKARKVMVTETGVLASGPQVADARAHDFRPRPASAAIDHGAKVFVPWGLYAVVGEWNFYRRPADPSVILGENVNWNREWYFRAMFQDIPRNNLKGHRIDASNFKRGTLENWTDGALELNGKDEYCALADAELKRDWSWTAKRFPSWVPKTKGTLDGKQRETVDMGTNNFLIEVVFKTKPGVRKGGIVCKCGQKGYVLEVARNAAAKMTLHFGMRSCSRTSAAAVNDGRWHHVIAEIDRTRREGVNIYVDGKLSNGSWAGRMDKTASLSNTADFTVGKTLPGAAGAGEEYFAGELDFLRVSRGTLEDAETTIDELHKWQFDGPSLRDFYGRPVNGKCRDAGAVEFEQP